MNRWVWPVRVLGVIIVFILLMLLLNLQRQLVQMQRELPAATTR